ncbi:death-associated inhibitor of apoptosis 2-like [Cloeon dipterum]|uniref:death-associated inhibitor of apoptosis 2-like n=1 Tax=Cloeon dipterum TaxID=197152 RepID=UPI0032203768
MIFGLPEKAYCKIWDVGSKNMPMGNARNYYFEAHRLYSLLKKNDWQYVGPFSLAKNGFFYTGDGDNVRCVFCNLEVRGWEEGDTADGEHRRWNPNCPFLRNEQSVGNVKIGSEQTDLKHDALVAIIPKGAQSYPVTQPAPVMDNQGAQLPAAVPQDEIRAPQGEIGDPQGEAVQQQDP